MLHPTCPSTGTGQPLEGPCLSRGLDKVTSRGTPAPSAAVRGKKGTASVWCVVPETSDVPLQKLQEKLKDLEHVTHVFKRKHCQLTYF